MAATLSCELHIRPDLLMRIMSSWSTYSDAAGDEKSSLTSYWEKHASYISLHQIGNDLIRVSGQSGFYFPGNSYSGLDTLNALMAFFRFRGHIVRRLSVPSIPEFTKTRIGPSWLPAIVNYDWFRVLDHIAAIREGQSTDHQFQNVAEIGSGTGILALAFKRIYPNAHYTCIDLPGTLHLACCFLACAMPNAKFVFPNELRRRWSDDADFIFVDNTSTHRIKLASQELYINTASMQEMNQSTIKDYFTLMRRTLTQPRLFYQSNREAKRMDGTIIRPVEFPWKDEDRHLFFRKNEFMRFVFGWRRKWGMPYVIPTRRKHLHSLTILSHSS